MPLTPDELFTYLSSLGIAHATISHPPLFTVEQSQALRALGCTEMQGYLFSPPVPPARLAKVLPRQRRRKVARAG